MEPENGTGSPLSDHFLLSACSEINSHFNLKEISQNRILHDARKTLDGWMLPAGASYRDGNRALSLSAPDAFRFLPIHGLSGQP